jgi:crotonobetainyl-CoA:carnitine CoA-transferase CaiB-like acyl-CoA transferase
MTEAAPAASGRLPLAGIRVLDLSRLMAGNMLTLQLADFGAEVIKVESAQGDTLRDWKNDGKPLWWKVYGRNKKSICLDLKDEGDREALLGLVPQAQVVIESFPARRHGSFRPEPRSVARGQPAPGDRAHLRLGPDRSLRGAPGFGTLVEAFSGFAQRNGFPDKPPALPNLGLADMIAGLSGAFATLAAVREVEVNGGLGRSSTCRCWSR